MSGRNTDYTHPASGRVYREGDPAHRFALLASALAAEAQEFLRHYERRIEGRDYLSQHLEWQSDPERIARTMADTIKRLDAAYTAVVVDRDMPDYGLGVKDEDWQRRYGELAQQERGGRG